MKKDLIFVQIAAYRDPELEPTIKDMIEKAAKPENLRFGICWQKEHGDSDLQNYQNNPQFRIFEIHWTESKGLGWARAITQSLYQGEQYTIQIDSHHRFIPSWDSELIQMYSNLVQKRYSKPIITTYANVYEPKKDDYINSKVPYKMVGTAFSSYGTILFVPSEISNYQELKEPERARFVSGHFFFTTGQHCLEYKYDPEIYFAGDEISLSIRSFTLGYDIFHPHKVILWHHYTRENRPKHWDDHNQNNKEKKMVDVTWSERDSYSKMRLRHLLKEEDNQIDLGQYGLGNVRTHEDYERYAGINFKYRKLQKYTIEGKTPPNPIIDDSWIFAPLFEYQILVTWSELDKCDDYKFLYIGIEDKNGNCLKRLDFDFLSYSHYFSGNNELLVSLSSDLIPYKWIIWPYSESKGWLKSNIHLIEEHNIKSKKTLSTNVVKIDLPIYISLTTIPSRISNIEKCLMSLLKQSLRPTKIFLNIPHFCKRENCSYELPSFLFSHPLKDMVEITRCDDFGPGTKLLGSLSKIPNESYLIICDDDLEYKPYFIEQLVIPQSLHHDQSYTFYAYYFNEMKIASGCEGISFYKKNLSDVENFARIALQDDYCYLVDDVWISAFLTKNRINICDLQYICKQKNDERPYTLNYLANPLSGITGKFNRDECLLKSTKLLKRLIT